MYVSEKFALLPGKNQIKVRCLDADKELRAVDLSAMDKPQVISLFRSGHLVKDEPEIGDAQEVFLYGKNALDNISWLNGPILYPMYRSVLDILGLKISSIALFELFAFSLVFLMLCLVVVESEGDLPTSFSAISLIIVINFAIAVTILPVLHSAAGMFLLTFLASSWFLWQRQFVLAARDDDADVHDEI